MREPVYRELVSRRGLRKSYPGQPHAECDGWALWRLRSPEAIVAEAC